MVLRIQTKAQPLSAIILWFPEGKQSSASLLKFCKDFNKPKGARLLLFLRGKNKRSTRLSPFDMRSQAC